MKFVLVGIYKDNVEYPSNDVGCSTNGDGECDDIPSANNSAGSAVLKPTVICVSVLKERCSETRDDVQHIVKVCTCTEFVSVGRYLSVYGS